MKGCSGGRRSHPLAARIKRLMQKDDDVGRIAFATPILISRALELFLRKLCTNAIEVAKNKKTRTVSPAHLKAYIHSEEMMDFLKPIVRDVTMLETPADLPHDARKRMRTSVSLETNTWNPKGAGKDTWIARNGTKRQRAPSPEALQTSASVSASNGTNPNSKTTCWKVSSTRSPSLQLSRSETCPTTIQERLGRATSLTSSSSVTVRETPIDPITVPLTFRKAVQGPSETKNSLPQNTTPVTTACSMSSTEMGAHIRDIETPITIHELSSNTSPIGVGLMPIETQTLNAEDENYDFPGEMADETS